MNTITQLSDFIRTAKSTIDYFRIQDFLHGQRGLNRLINDITQFPESYIADLSGALNDILAAQQHSDNILIADLLEIQLLPYAENILQQLILESSENIFTDYLEENLNCLKDKTLAETIRSRAETAVNSSHYRAETTNMGVYTLKLSDGDDSFYYHSNTDPFREADLLAEYYADNSCFDYTVFGFGLGYHIRSLLNIDRRFSVTVLESNPDVLSLAFVYCDLRDILTNTRFELIYCTTDMIARKLPHNEQPHRLIIHYPSLSALRDENLKSALNNYFINTSSMLGQQKYLDWNFYYNMKLNDRPVDDILPALSGKSVIYIGGGPSLEYQLSYLQNRQTDGESIVICASTVYKKLLSFNIIPDYVIMTDPQDNMINHVNNTPATASCLLYLCTASSRAVAAFDGVRYIMFQSGYANAEEYSSHHNYIQIDTGGSVSTSAIDLILRAGCRELITLGLDLAHTDNKHHSFVAAGNTTGGSHGAALMVKSVAGGLVPTTNVLNIYRLWIEKRLLTVSGTSLINVSHGAYINGMKNVMEI